MMLWYRRSRRGGLWNKDLSLRMMWVLCWKRLMMSEVCRLKFTLLSSVIPRYLKLSTISTDWLSMYMASWGVVCLWLLKWVLWSWWHWGGDDCPYTTGKSGATHLQHNVCLLWLSLGPEGEPIWQCHLSIWSIWLRGIGWESNLCKVCTRMDSEHSLVVHLCLWWWRWMW